MLQLILILTVAHRISGVRIVAEVIVAVMYFVNIYLETWSLTLREERRLRVSEERVLSRIFGPKREKLIGRSLEKAA
jgi:uncharacterized membrane protein